MTVTVNVSRIFAIIRQMAGFAAPIIASLNVGTLPASVRGGLAVFGGIVLAAEHIGEKVKSKPASA